MAKAAARTKKLPNPLEAFDDVWVAFASKRWPLLGVLSLAVVVDAAVNAVALLVSGMVPLLAVPLMLAAYVLQCWAGVSLLRGMLILLSGSKEKWTRAWALDQRTFNYLGVLLFCLLVATPFAIPAFLCVWAWENLTQTTQHLLIAAQVLCFGGLVYVQVRLYPAMVLAAAGLPQSLETAWAATRGQVARSLGFFALAIGPLVACGLLAALAVAAGGHGYHASFFLVILLVPVAFYFMALIIASQVYWAMQLVPALAGDGRKASRKIPTKKHSTKPTKKRS
jgi:hypothetical protein